jgi:ubiquinone/menaquinone biosynthesis C-methylase UbiE
MKPEGSFPPERLIHLEKMERNHFWFRGRRKLIEQLMRRAGLRPPGGVLDIGAGGGAFSLSLAKEGFVVTAIDFLTPGLRKIRERNPSVRVLQSSAEHLALRDGSASAVFLLDILEHVDDSRVLSEARRC